jgi:DNA adenine methylase
VKPLLKWAGGKARLAPSISEAFGAPCRGTYYEPFVGSGAVYLHRKAAGEVGRAVLADVNPKLLHVHVAVQQEVEEVLDALDRLPREGYQDHYYAVRDAYNRGPFHGAVHAARFIWLNRAGFNGLYRENRRGEFNVPVGRYTQLSLPPPEAFRAVSAMLAEAELVVADFRAVMRRAGPGDQVYCDPPYVPLTETANFTGYCKEPFGDDEQRALALLARGAGARGATVVLSNHDTAFVCDELYACADGFRHVAKPRVARAISRAAASRAGVSEVIAAIGPRASLRR